MADNKKDKKLGIYTTGVVRLSYPQLWAAKAFEDGGKAKFGCTLLSPRKGEKLSDAFGSNDKSPKSLSQVIFDVKKAAWGPDKSKWSKGQPIFHDGNAKSDTEGYKGMAYISPKNERRIVVLDQKKSPIAENSAEIYAGCFVRAVVRAYAYPKGPKWGAGVALSLEAVQKHSDGDPFEGRVDVMEYLDEIEDSSESEENYSDDDDDGDSW